MKRRLTTEEIEAIQQMHQEGSSYRAIAAALHINQTTVSRWTRAMREVDSSAPTAVELLESAYPWSVRLPLEDQQQFAHELAHHSGWVTEAYIDNLVRSWRLKALGRAS